MRYRLRASIESARLDTSEILVLGKCLAARIDELKLLRMELASPVHIRLDESARRSRSSWRRASSFVFARVRNAADHEKSEREDQSVDQSQWDMCNPCLRSSAA